MKHLRKFNENDRLYYQIISSNKRWLDLDPLSEVEKSVLRIKINIKNSETN